MEPSRRAELAAVLDDFVEAAWEYDSPQTLMP
jgi:hypothetical protein